MIFGYIWVLKCFVLLYFSTKCEKSFLSKYLLLLSITLLKQIDTLLWLRFKHKLINPFHATSFFIPPENIRKPLVI